MAVKVVSRKYGNRYRPEDTTFLIGNVGDLVTLELEADFAVEFVADQQNSLLVNGNEFTLTNGKTWGDYGFAEGDTGIFSFTLVITDNNGNPTYLPANAPITFGIIQGATAEINFISSISFPSVLPSVQSSDISYIDIKIWADKKPETIDIFYNLLSNDDKDSLSLNSFIDGNKTKLRANGTASNTSGLLENMGLQSGMAVTWKNSDWTFVNKIGTHTYRYKFKIRYIIHGIYEDITNLEDKVAPNVLFNANALTDCYLILGYPQHNNPNVLIQSDPNKTKQNGNTGWFDENYNQLPNVFTVKSVEYFDVQSGVQISSLNFLAPTKVRAVIGGIQNPASLLSYPLFVWTPIDTDTYVNNNPNPYHYRVRMNYVHTKPTPFTISGSPDPTLYSGIPSVVGGNDTINIRNVRYSLQGSDVVFEAEYVPTTDFTNFYLNVPNERFYLLGLSVADSTLPTRYSNRVTLLLDFSEMIEYKPPVGAWNPSSGFTYTYGNEIFKIAQSCSDIYVQDLVLKSFNFGVDLNNNIRPERITFALEAKSPQGGKYTLQNDSIDLTGFPSDSNGVPQYNYVGNAGYTLWNNSQFNLFELKRNPTLDFGSIYYYTAYYGFTIRYEDWIQNNILPNDFFNALQEHNGFNEDWYNIMTLAGWSFVFTAYIDANDGNRYENEYALTFSDYDSNSNLTKTWSATREDLTPLVVNINPNTGLPLIPLLGNERTYISIDFVKNVGNFNAISNYEIEATLEVWNGSGYLSNRRIISYATPENGNPLEPITGQTTILKALVNPNTIRGTFAVNPNLLQGATNYRFTARLICGGAVLPPLPIGGFWIDEYNDYVIDEFNNKIIVN